MNLIALQEFSYQGKQYHSGDQFDAPDLHAKLLIQGGRARARATEGKYQTAAVIAEDKPQEPRTPRRYKRRDMRAEE